ELLVLVDIDLDELDLAIGLTDGLFEEGGQLLAGAAPRRPEIDQHRLLARWLDHIRHETARVGVLDEVRRQRGGGAAISAGLLAENRGIHAELAFRCGKFPGKCLAGTGSRWRIAQPIATGARSGEGFGAHGPEI